MTVIKSLFIASVEPKYNADYIMDAFYCHNVATISRVTLVPCETRRGLKYRAYIDIHEWHPSEAAYNFIQRLKDTSKEARFVYNDDNWWVVEVNKKSYITTSPKTAQLTTINYLVTAMSEPECLPWMLSRVHYEDQNEWNEIEKELSEMLAYQNLEYELCL